MNARVHQPDTFPNRRGFALVIALSLMAFIVLLLLSLAAFTRVEISNASTEGAEIRARMNAMYAMRSALAQLQSAAGPDQRVTARAEILGDGSYHPQNQYWTGVWNTTQMDTEPKWLVSGPGNVRAQGSVLIAGNDFFGPLADRHVYVDAVPIDQQNPIDVIAYWVSDEGVKASIAKNGRLDQFNANPTVLRLDPLEFQRLLQSTADRPRFEKLFDSIKTIEEANAHSPIDVWDQNAGNAIDTTISSDQLEIISTLNQVDPAAQIGELQYHRPDLTYLSRGVLVNTKRGGLKKDLSNPHLVDNAGPFPLDASVRQFLGTRPNLEDQIIVTGHDISPSGPRTTNPYQTGNAVASAGPVLTEFAVYLGVYKTNINSNRLRCEITVRGDLWNPYATSMGFSPTGTDDLEIQVLGLPRVSGLWETGKGSPNRREYERGRFSFYPNRMRFPYAESRRTFSVQEGVAVDIRGPLGPGELQTFQVRSSLDLSERIRDHDPGIQRDFIHLDAPRTNLTIRLLTRNGRLIQEFQNVEFTSLDAQANLRSRENLVPYGEYQAAYHFQFEEELQLNQLQAWSSEVDPRQAIIDLSNEDNGLVYVNDDPAMAAADLGVFARGTTFFFGGNGVFYAPSYLSFFDYPTIEPVSIGFLQHLQFEGKGPFAIGNPWGQNHNAAFDRYFFSTLNQRQYGDPLPNHHLETHPTATVDPTNPNQAAAAFLLTGAFNANSTSVDAWRSMLSSVHLYNWQYRQFDPDEPALRRQHVKNAVFRFPHNANRTAHHPATTGDDGIENYPEATQADKGDWYKRYRKTATQAEPEWSAAYSVGMRELRDGNNPDQIDDVTELASAIVDQLRVHGQPFSSIKELVNSGLLQDAIDQTRINTASLAAYEDEANAANKFPRYSPSFVTQADLLNVLAPYLQVRSDTFVIRAFGEAKDPITHESKAQAWCEALVQRFPEPVGIDFPSSTDYENPASQFGRKFYILEFQWLSEKDI
ncbi:MAG: hypothetical protein AAFX93_09315 [Verrucomicrobiota bacterium]